LQPRSSFPEPALSQLDSGYSPSHLVPEFRSVLAEYREASDVAKQALRCELYLRYGEGEGELLHYFPPLRPSSPFLIYVHGGHWQELGIDDSCFAAPALVERGAGFAAVGYELAPAGTLDAMVASVALALEWVVDNAAALGTAPGRIHAAGSSAGAHLLAMALGSGPAGARVGLAGVTLMSGVYELSGIQRSYVNEALGLAAADARRNSPVHHLPLRAREVLVARGEVETAEYGRQHDSLLTALQDGSADSEQGGARSLVCRGRNHFDLPLGLGDPGDELGAAVLDQMRLGSRAR
jgi:arylformamidase